MVLLKACPRCGGDMHRNRDIYGDYTSCLNCGYLLDVSEQEGQRQPMGQGLQRKAA